MKNFFRVQGKGLTLEEMQSHNSADGASKDGPHEGLCAADSVCQLRSYLKQADFRPERDDKDMEVVIYEGRRIETLYDGVTTYPIKIHERVTLTEFLNDDRFLEYE